MFEVGAETAEVEGAAFEEEAKAADEAEAESEVVLSRVVRSAEIICMEPPRPFEPLACTFEFCKAIVPVVSGALKLIEPPEVPFVWSSEDRFICCA